MFAKVTLLDSGCPRAWCLLLLSLDRRQAPHGEVKPVTFSVFSIIHHFLDSTKIYIYIILHFVHFISPHFPPPLFSFPPPQPSLAMNVGPHGTWCTCGGHNTMQGSLSPFIRSSSGSILNRYACTARAFPAELFTGPSSFLEKPWTP